jgi:cytochrome c oxidase subunit 2
LFIAVFRVIGLGPKFQRAIMKFSRLIVLAVALVLTDCGTTQKFAAVPADLNRDQVPRQTIAMSAGSYAFTPEEVHVKPGTILELRITAIDGTHGFALGAFGIDERLEKGKTKVIEVYLPEAGEYDFHCSHFCGMGHFSMNGRIIAE